MNGKELGEPITDLREIKDLELQILNAVADFCDRRGLRYFLAYGTLLGAVRHQGFIPWDDDIDIVMPRSDYEKLLEQWDSDCGYELLECRQNRDYAYPFAKVCNGDTFLQEHDVTARYDMGIYIDIFPLDGIRDTEEGSESLLRWFVLMEKLRMYSMMPCSYIMRDDGRKTLQRKLLWQLLQAVGPHRISLAMDRKARKYGLRGGKYGGFLSTRYPEREILPLEIYGKTTELEFEGRMYHAPQNYDLVLTRLYGDYMELPPEEERVLKHNFRLFKCK